MNIIFYRNNINKGNICFRKKRESRQIISDNKREK